MDRGVMTVESFYKVQVGNKDWNIQSQTSIENKALRKSYDFRTMLI